MYDEETGWYYLQSRYYNPEIGRFVSSDVYLSTGQGVLGHNAYAYCLNNPICFQDSTGSIPVTDILEFFRETIEGGGGGAAEGSSNGEIASVSNGGSNASSGGSAASVNSGGGIIVGCTEEKVIVMEKAVCKWSSSHTFAVDDTFLLDGFYSKNAPKQSIPNSSYTNYNYNSYAGKYGKSTAYYDFA